MIRNYSTRSGGGFPLRHPIYYFYFSNLYTSVDIESNLSISAFFCVCECVCVVADAIFGHRCRAQEVKCQGGPGNAELVFHLSRCCEELVAMCGRCCGA